MLNKYRGIARRLSLGMLAASVLVAIGFFSIQAYQRRPGAAVITIDPMQRFQEIRGWEATAQAGLDAATSQDYAAELLDAAVEFGLTRLRVEVRSSYEHTRDIDREFREARIDRPEYRCARYSTVNDNADPHVIDWSGFIFAELDRSMKTVVLPLRERLARRGERLWVNINYTAFTNDVCNGYAYVHDQPEEYAEFVLAVYEHLRKTYGFAPDSWEVMLEPDNTRIWSGERMAQAMVRTAARLQEAGFTPSFVAPSTTTAGNALRFFEPMWNTESLRPFLTEISYHRYGSTPERTIAEIGRVAEQRGLATSMLEKIGAGHMELNQDLTLGRVSAWQQYTLAFPVRDDGAHYFMMDPAAPPGQRVWLSASARYLQPYFRTIRPGARRVGASSDHADFKPVAVRNPNGGLAVVVSTSRPGQLTVQRLEPGAYRVSCWTDRSSLDDASSRCEATAQVGESGSLVVHLPGIGVLSIERHDARSSR